jgi:hypothetical protein
LDTIPVRLGDLELPAHAEQARACFKSALSCKSATFWFACGKAVTPAAQANGARPMTKQRNLPAQAPSDIDLSGADPLLPTSTAVHMAEQSALGASALSAARAGLTRGAARQKVAMAAAQTVLDRCRWHRFDGLAPQVLDSSLVFAQAAQMASTAGFAVASSWSTALARGAKPNASFPPAPRPHRAHDCHLGLPGAPA